MSTTRSAVAIVADGLEINLSMGLVGGVYCVNTLEENCTKLRPRIGGALRRKYYVSCSAGSTANCTAVKNAPDP